MKILLGALSLLMLCVVPASAGVLVTDVEVDVGSSVWCNVGSSLCSSATAATPWNLGAGVPLNPGDTLVLTQTAGYNFDTSDACPSPADCLAPRILVNGVAFTDLSKILAGQGQSLVDPVTLAFNEAHDWLDLGPISGLLVGVAYADNLHTDPCVGPCVPSSPWTDATAFFGAGSDVVPAGFTIDSGGHCSFREASCYDAGAIYIGAVPEPATWLLMALGFVLMGFALKTRRAI